MARMAPKDKLLDETGQQLLRLLEQNARASLAELGRRVWSLLERYEERNERPELRPDGSRPVAFLNLAFPRIRRGRAAPEAVDEAGPATPVQPRTADDSEPGPPAEPEAAGG